MLFKKSDEEIAAEEYHEEVAEDVTTGDTHNEPEIVEDVQEEIYEEEGVIMWEAPEIEYVEKSTTWYWVSMAIAIVLIAIALWQKNFLFAVFVMIAELAVFMFAGEKPKMWEFTIDEVGVTIEGHKTYKYKDITLYDVHEFSDEYAELVLQTKSKVHHYVKIFIPVEYEEEIREVLDGKIKHGEIEVSLLETLERSLGF